MEPRISLITLGVADVARARTFYEALGWRGHEVQETVFVQAGQQALVLWARDLVATDAGLHASAGIDGFGGITLAHNVRSRAEVDTIVATAYAAGAKVTKEPTETFYGGYAGFFRDLDGHVWEIAHNPGFTLTEDGALVLPDFDAPT
jgi:predicted lactoylglutathione lyase